MFVAGLLCFVGFSVFGGFVGGVMWRVVEYCGCSGSFRVMLWLLCGFMLWRVKVVFGFVEGVGDTGLWEYAYTCVVLNRIAYVLLCMLSAMCY